MCHASVPTYHENRPWPCAAAAASATRPIDLNKDINGFESTVTADFFLLSKIHFFFRVLEKIPGQLEV